jgi:cytochrome c553
LIARLAVAVFLPFASFAAQAADDAAGGRAAGGEPKALACAPCHGAGGHSTDPTVPSLAGQPPIYVEYQLIQFHEGRRKDERMSPLAAGLTGSDMKDLAAYFAAQPPPPAAPARDAAKAAAGKAVTDRYHCGSCHMPDFSGQKHIARLAAQHEGYLVKTLRGFKDGTRTDIDGMMVESAAPLTDADILDVSYYLATFNP